MDTIVFYDDDGNEIELFVVMDTTINETKYILVSDTDPTIDEYEVMILKNTGIDEDDELYEALEEGEEYEGVKKVFEELFEEYFAEEEE